MKAISEKTTKMILRMLCGIILCTALMFVMMMLGKVFSTDTPWETSAGVLFGVSFICFGLYELLFYFYKKSDTNEKLGFMNVCYAAIFTCAGIVGCLSLKFPVLFAISGTMALSVPLIKRVVSVVRNHTIRNIIFNLIVEIINIYFFVETAKCINSIDFAGFMLAGLFCGIMMSVTCFVSICSLALSNVNKEVLLDVIRKTYAGEIIFGLLIIMVAFSMVLMMVETSINNFLDALWYCFTIVTTIGLGDFAAASIIGRILSVILGIYGIIVVAIVTSIIVNFYNEVKDKNSMDDAQKKESNTKEDS